MHLKVSYVENAKEKVRVQLCWSGYLPLPIHRRYPTTARHGDFCLLRHRPGPVHPSLDNLGTLGSPGATILMPGLVRTPDRHRTMTGRTPDLKSSTSPGLQVAGLQECATTPSHQHMANHWLICVHWWPLWFRETTSGSGAQHYDTVIIITSLFPSNSMLHVLSWCWEV